MSRAYRVTWVTVASNVSTDDTLTMNLSLLGILPDEDMATLLREELARRGWKPGEGGVVTGAVQGLDAVLSPDGAKVTVTARAEGDVTARGTNRDDAKLALERAEGAARDELKAGLAKRLTAAEPDLRAMMGEAIQRVYVEALKRKAASMGAVESLHETRGSDGEYEVTIKVRT
jgi:hypothetical protein